jgi:hypothetical protein
VTIVQTPLELIAEEIAQALSGANAVDQPHGGPHALRREVHGERIVQLGCRRRDVSVPEHGGGDRVVE